MVNKYVNLMRLDRPIGIFLLLWPTLWALWLASKGLPPISILFIFIIGSFVMRTAGCIINDFIDLKVDSHVARTKNRALVSGDVSKMGALIVLFTLLCFALALVIQLNMLSFKIAVIGIICISVYPFLKRVTGMVQFFLGITFAISILMAFAAIKNQIPIYAWILYLINIIWIVSYDTIYSLMDKKDDIKINVYSTAILFDGYEKELVFVLQFLVSMSLIVLGLILKLGILYLVCVSLTIFLFLYQHRLIMKNKSENFMQAFINNNWVGLLVFIGFILADYSSANI